MKNESASASAKPAGGQKSRTSKTLLAAACGMLGAGVGGVQAGVVSEPPDFSNAFFTPTVLPLGTNQVTGHVSTSDTYDWFRFDDLGGAVGTVQMNYSLSAPDRYSEYSLRVSFYDSSNFFLGEFNLGATGPGVVVGSIMLNVPVNGQIVTWVNQDQDDSGKGTAYTIGFDVAGDPAGVPAPATGGLAALGAAALFARRRRKPRGE